MAEKNMLLRIPADKPSILDRLLADYRYKAKILLEPNLSHFEWGNMMVLVWRHGPIEERFGSHTFDRWEDFAGNRYFLACNALRGSIHKLDLIDSLAGWYLSGIPFLRMLLDALRMFFAGTLAHFLLALEYGFRNTLWIEPQFPTYLTIRPPLMPLNIWQS
jgi:hypothetical protein